MKYVEKLRPLPDCVVLRFDPAKTETDAVKRDDGKQIVVELDQNIRYEIGEIVAIGRATDYRNMMIREELGDRMSRGERVPIRWTSGTCYGDNLPTGAAEMEWLKSLRVYRFSEVLVSIPQEQSTS